MEGVESKYYKINLLKQDHEPYYISSHYTFMLKQQMFIFGNETASTRCSATPTRPPLVLPKENLSIQAAPRSPQARLLRGELWSRPGWTF